MPTRQGLDLVIRVATDRRDGAALALAGSRRQAEEAHRKLETLSRYLQGYRARMNGGLEAGRTDPVRMANTRAFIQKLEHAIAQQQREVDARDSHSKVCTGLLNAKEMKLNSLQTLRERQADEARRAEGRREQKRTDEFGARAARNGGATLDFRSA
jgi:flagellar FliJ protein